MKIIIAVALTGVVLFLYDLIVRDTGGPIFAASSPKAYTDMVRFFGMCKMPAQVWLPSFDADKNLLVDRAGIKGGAIINYTSPAYRRTAVDNSVVGYQFVTSTPHADAALMAGRLSRAGYQIKLVPDPDPNIAKGKMAFVVVRGMLDQDQPIVYVFRRHKFLMGPKPPSWSERPAILDYAP